MSDDTKPVVGLVTIGPYIADGQHRVDACKDGMITPGPRLAEATQIAERVTERVRIRQDRIATGRSTGRKSRDEDRKMEAKIATDAIEAALEEFELACVSAGLTARQRDCFIEHVSKLELAKRAVRK